MAAAKRKDPGPSPVEYGFGFLGRDPKTGGFPETGKIYMMRCYKCGKENYGPMIATGTCAWCGYNANEDEALRAEFSQLDELQRRTGYRRVIT